MAALFLKFRTCRSCYRLTVLAPNDTTTWKCHLCGGELEELPKVTSGAKE